MVHNFVDISFSLYSLYIYIYFPTFSPTLSIPIFNEFDMVVVLYTNADILLYFIYNKNKSFHLFLDFKNIKNILKLY